MDDRIRKTLIATVKVRNFWALANTLEDLGVRPADILQSVGIEPNLFSNPERTLLFSDLDRLMTRCLETTKCEAFGLRLGMKQGPATIGLAGLVSMHSPTVREALQVIIAGLKTTDTGAVVTLDVLDGVARLGYSIIAPGIKSADQITDGAMAMLANAMRRFCDPTWRPTRVLPAAGQRI